MISISASQQEADITGSIDDLREIGLTIRALLLSANESVTLRAADHDPTPFDRAVPELTVNLRTGPLSIAVQGNALCVSASAERLEEFASCFFFPEDARDGHHFHFESMSGDSDYSADSLALAVSVHRSGA